MTAAPQQSILIRRIHVDDLDAIQALYIQQLAADSDPFSQIRISQKQFNWQMRILRQQWLSEQKYLAFVASIPRGEGSEEIIGYIAAVVESHARFFQVESYASIGELWVMPQYRRHGIGSALAKELLKMIDRIGIDWITVNIPENDETTHQFFQKTGFSKCAIEMRCHLSELPVTDDSETGIQ